MDFHSLSRKDLQALCKKNGIPANMTNVSMAEALKALQNIEGIEDVQRPKSPSEAEARSVDLPRTCRRTSTRGKPTKELVISMENVPGQHTESSGRLTRSRIAAIASTARRIIDKEEEPEKEDKKFGIPETPVTHCGRKRVTGTSIRRGINTCNKEDKQKEEQKEDNNSVNRVYTRRSSHLLSEKKLSDDASSTTKCRGRRETNKSKALSEEFEDLENKLNEGFERVDVTDPFIGGDSKESVERRKLAEEDGGVSCDGVAVLTSSLPSEVSDKFPASEGFYELSGTDGEICDPDTIGNQHKASRDVDDVCAGKVFGAIAAAVEDSSLLLETCSNLESKLSNAGSNEKHLICSFQLEYQKLKQIQCNAASDAEQADSELKEGFDASSGEGLAVEEHHGETCNPEAISNFELTFEDTTTLELSDEVCISNTASVDESIYSSVICEVESEKSTEGSDENEFPTEIQKLEQEQPNHGSDEAAQVGINSNEFWDEICISNTASVHESIYPSVICEVESEKSTEGSDEKEFPTEIQKLEQEHPNHGSDAEAQAGTNSNGDLNIGPDLNSAPKIFPSEISEDLLMEIQKSAKVLAVDQMQDSEKCKSNDDHQINHLKTSPLDLPRKEDQSCNNPDDSSPMENLKLEGGELFPDTNANAGDAAAIQWVDDISIVEETGNLVQDICIDDPVEKQNPLISHFNSQSEETLPYATEYPSEGKMLSEKKTRGTQIKNKPLDGDKENNNENDIKGLNLRLEEKENESNKCGDIKQMAALKDLSLRKLKKLMKETIDQTTKSERRSALEPLNENCLLGD